MSTITLTYGDVCENHVGMQQIGKLASNGLPTQLLETIQQQFPQNAELIRLNTLPSQSDASILIIRNGVELLLPNTLTPLYQEQNSLEPDKKALIRGRVVNKRARYNLCFSTTGQSPDYETGKGTIVAFDQVPYTRLLGHKLAQIFGTEPLECEGNYYFDSNAHISLHGDTERRVVIGVRMGVTIPLMYWWFQNFRPVGDPITLMLNHGDIYVMSEKAVGFDWKRSSIMTLRHSAGSLAFLEKEKKRIWKKVADRETVMVSTPAITVVVPQPQSDLIIDQDEIIAD